MPANRLYPVPILGRDAGLLVDHNGTRRSLPLMIVMLALLAALVGFGVFMLSRIACDTPPIRHSGHALAPPHSSQIGDLSR